MVSLSNCPPKLRGDLSKWLLEISTGVYAGHINAKVREHLWQRICANLTDGRATIVWSSSGEQHMDFAVHNSVWEPRDYDGIKLIWHPSEQNRQQSECSENCSTELENTKDVVADTLVRRKNNIILKSVAEPSVSVSSEGNKKCSFAENYVIIDFETTGFFCYKDEIIEAAALRIVDSQPAGEYQALIYPVKGLPKHITDLTGLSLADLERSGRPLADVLGELLVFIGDLPLAGHNVSFDYRFLQSACKRFGMPVPPSPIIDSLRLARNRIKDVKSYKLIDLADHFGLDVSNHHRALADCYTTYYLLKNLRNL